MTFLEIYQGSSLVMEIFNSYFIKIKKNSDILEGLLFFITDFEDLKFIRPHELVIKDKVNAISKSIRMSALTESPFLCVSDNDNLRFNNLYETKFSYLDDGELVYVSYSQSNINFQLKSPLLLADGHHIISALRKKSLFLNSKT